MEGIDQKGARLELNAVVTQKLDFKTLFDEKLKSLGIVLHDQVDRDQLLKGSQKLEAVLKLILYGDANAAKYTMLSILSYNSKRVADMPPIGNIPVNLSNLEQETANVLMNFLSEIMPGLLPLKITVKSL